MLDEKKTDSKLAKLRDAMKSQRCVCVCQNEEVAPKSTDMDMILVGSDNHSLFEGTCFEDTPMP